MPADVRISSASVVVVGAFAPATFHPAWFARNNLLPEQEATAAKIEIVHPDMAQFQTEWLNCDVTQQRFGVTCIREDSLPLLVDLIAGVLQLFPALPVGAFGINREMHFQMESAQAMHAVGHRLAPKEPWNALLTGPGMLGVSMQGQRTDNRRGKINVLVEPSGKVEFGVFVRVNDHFDMGDAKEPKPAEHVVSVLRTVWRESLERSLKIATSILTS